ncbi:MAG: energy transducer TonB [bacterium]|nr:energy transducer TonB [bacterium]
MKARYWHFLLIALATATGARAQGTSLDEGPSIVIREAAYYSRSMRLAAMEDSVAVRVVIAPSGAVEAVREIGWPRSPFRSAAMLAAWLSKYRPARRDGLAVRDSLMLEFHFVPDRDTDGVIKSDTTAAAHQILELETNQVCLYGHWISGNVVVRRSENRVYIDGIRVFPDITNFDDRDVIPTPVMAPLLRSECSMLERELALQSWDRSLIRQRTLSFISEFERIASATAVTMDSVAVRLTDGTSVGFTLGDPYDTESYWASQPKMADPVVTYYAWLQRLHRGVRKGFYIFRTGHGMSMSLRHATAIAIRSHLAALGPERNGQGGVEFPDDLCGLVPGMCDMIRKPLPAPRL